MPAMPAMPTTALLLKYFSKLLFLTSFPIKLFVSCAQRFAASEMNQARSANGLPQG